MSRKSLYNVKNKTNMDIININIFLKMEKNDFGSFCSSFFYNFAFFCVFIFSKKKCKIDTFFFDFRRLRPQNRIFLLLAIIKSNFSTFLIFTICDVFCVFLRFFAFFTIFTIFPLFFREYGRS